MTHLLDYFRSGRLLRHLTLAVVMAGCFLSASAAVWTTDYAAAVAQAKTEHKKILLDFTGSDWCEWCIKLDAEVYKTDEFAAYAAKNLVLVTLDYPEQTKLSPALQKQNNAMKLKYKIAGFPTTVLLDANEKTILSITGYVAGGPKVFIPRIDGTSPEGMLDRSKAAYEAQDFDGAIADCTQAIALDAKYATAYIFRAEAKEGKHDDTGAMADLKQVIELDPKNADAYNAAAWILAVSSNASLRDGKKAVEYATKAVQLSGGTDPNPVDTLAAAYAESGDFADAIKYENLYLTASLEKAAADEGRQRLALYQQKKPYHEPAK